MTMQRFVLDKEKMVSRKQKPRTTAMASQKSSLSVAADAAHDMAVVSSSSLTPSMLRSLQERIGNKRVQQLLERKELQLGAKPPVSVQMIPGYMNKSRAMSPQLQMQPTVQMDKKKEVYHSTPLPKGAVPQGNKVVVKVGGADVTILPDARTKSKKLDKKAFTAGSWQRANVVCVKNEKGDICSSVKIVTPARGSIRTTYGPNAERSGPSAYGRERPKRT